MHSTFNLLDIPTNLTDFQRIVLTGLFGLATAILIYRLNKRKERRNMKIQDFTKAAFVFRHILEKDIEYLKVFPADEKFFVSMEKRFDSYESAMLGLKDCLPTNKMIVSFERAWESYKYGGHENEKQVLKHVRLSTFHLIEDEETVKRRTIDNINKLIKFCNSDYVF